MLAVFQKVLHLSLTGSIIAAAVICLRPFLKQAPKWMLCLLWGLVALRLVCPISPESSLSLVPDRVATGQIISNVAGIPLEDERIQSVPDGWSEQIPTTDGVFHFYGAPIQPVNTVGSRILPVLCLIWISGTGLMLGYCILSYILLRHRMAEATRLRDNIWQCGLVDSPFVLGLIRPRIYLPYRISNSDMEQVIAHEQAHIHRLDHWWKPLGFVLLSVHWFNPVLWLSYLLLCRDIEAACDERVIRSMEKVEKQAYSAALLHCSVDRKFIAACPLAFGEVSVKERVKNVMHYKKPAFRVIVLAVAVCIVVAVCFLTNPLTPSMEVLPLVHSHSYGVAEAVYESPTLGVRELLGARFRITENMEFGLKAANVSYTGWVELGTLTEIRLTRENFDRLFHDNAGWFQNENAAYIRQNAAHVWELVREDLEQFYYLIQMTNGELLLASGYYDTAEKQDPGSDDTAVSVLYRLEVDLTADYNLMARSGGYAVPLTIFPAGTAIGNYAKTVQYLTIDPGEEFTSFRVFRNGEEVMGHFLAFDAETYEQLPYTIPSGLSPQTYLFQNADPDRDYIVVMKLTSDAQIYCFGARFRQDGAEEQGSVVMVPTDSALEGIYDRYLYMTLDGVKYRYERQDTMPGGIQTGGEVATVTEGNTGMYYTVFSVAGCEDNSMFLVHSQDMDMMWLYRYSPSKACSPVELHNAINSGFIVMEQGYMTHGQQSWYDFYQKTRQGIAASVRLAHYYTLDPNQYLDIYVEAYREDYPQLYLQELTFDGSSYTLRNIGGEAFSKSYPCLMCYVDDKLTTEADGSSRTVTRYVLTHDNRVTWQQLFHGLVSSQEGAYIDHYTVLSTKQ